jgi:hypothetical protein
MCFASGERSRLSIFPNDIAIGIDLKDRQIDNGYAIPVPDRLHLSDGGD